MRIGRAVRVLALCVAFVCCVVFAGGGLVLAKGQLTPGGVTTTPSTSSASWLDVLAREILGSISCAPPTVTECTSVDYASTTCGARELRNLRVLGVSRCDAQCPVPTLEDCRDTDFVLSVCGARETRAVENKAPPDACNDENPGTTCPSSGSQCGDLLRADLESMQDTGGSVLPADTPVATVIIPASTTASTGNPIEDLLSLEQNGYANPLVVESTRVLPPSYARWEAPGASSRLWNENTMDLVSKIDPANNLSSNVLRRLFFTQQRAAWDANGNNVNSCREYVYEKYYDYALFEDAIKGPGARARRVWDVAYGPADVRSSVGTRGVNQESLCQQLAPNAECSDVDIRQKDGTFLPLELRMPKVSRPKNEFFATPVPSAAGRADALSRWNANTKTYTVTLKLAGNHTFTTSRPLAISAGGLGAGGVFLLDEGLHTALTNAPFVDESWTYHKTMGELIGPEVDEQAEILDKLRETFPPLLARRANVASEIGLVLKGLLPKVPDLRVNGVLFDPTIFETVINPSSLGSAATLSRIRDVIDAESTGSLSIYGISPQLPSSSASLLQQTTALNILAGAGNIGATNAGPMMPMSGSLSTSVFNLSQLSLSNAQSLADIVAPALGGEWGSASQRLTRLFRELARVEGEIEAALLEARERDCLNTTGFTTCDWSPQRFLQRVADHFQVERERDFARCKKYTGDSDFSERAVNVAVSNRFVPVLGNARVVYPPWSPNTATTCDDGPYHTSPTRLERYMGCYDTWMKASIANLESALVGAAPLVDPTTGEIVPAETDSDSQRQGDKVFGVGYAYHAYWQVNGLANVSQGNGVDDWCAIRPRFDGNFRVDGRFLGGKFDLVDAEAYVTTVATDPKNSRAYLELGGFEIIDVDVGESGFDPSKYNVIFDETEGGQDQYFSFKQSFPVGPIWISVGGGVAGFYGARALGAAGTLPDRAGGCAQGSFGIEGVFSPFFGFEGFATASLDYLVVEAGVKIALTIVSLHLPFKTQLRFEGQQTSTNPARYDTRLRLVNDLDVVLKILDGRVSAFVEVCFILCESFEVTLFSWDGPRWEANIFHSLFDLPMGTLVDFQETLSAQVGANLP
jgi:hypothetical protein